MKYTSLHERLKRERGVASRYTCVKCGKRAAEWALRPGKGRLTERVGSSVLRYSLDLADYEPMCVSCHRRMDLPTLCRRGLHRYVSAVQPNGRYRMCGECRRISNAAAYQRRKEAGC